MGMSAFKMTARGDRPEWSEVKDRIDLAAVATSLLGPAPGRRGERGRRLWWPCPFHDDHNPSLAVDPGRKSWRCFGCGENGDAAALVMKLNQCTFPEAVRWLAEQAGVVPTSSRPRPPSGGPKRPRPPAASPTAKAPEKPARLSSGLPLADCPEAGGGRRRCPLDARGSGRLGLSPWPWTDRGDHQDRPPRVDTPSCRRALEAPRRGYAVV
jgi:CHC2-type zinc finger protein